jgi:predicted ATPase/class 3 adenylate cyclase
MLVAMPAQTLPEGTLTMLFSDIEGSTALLTRLGARRYADVLGTQRQVVREAVVARGGHEMGTEGDSHFVVFASAVDAVAAAAQVQRGLCARDWPAGARVRVRMGLHTGEPERHEDGYVGLAVHRAARVAAAAHGGQVLLTAATWGLVGDACPAGVTARAVGEHRLKDVPVPERLYRLRIDGVPEVDTPPRGLGGTASLPQPNTPLVGRDEDLAMLDGFLSQERRLVTLVGPGGVGKTRLAVEAAARAADRFPGGVHFVDLSPVTDVGSAWVRVAQVIPADGSSGEDDTPREVVARYTADRRCLFVLDNLEHLADGGALVSDLLDLLTVARGSVVVTSRQPLRLLGEQELPVEPLPVPAAGARDAAYLQAVPSVQLFLQHARRARPGLSPSAQEVGDIGLICTALDGLPLAVEIAAVRLRLLSPRQLLQGLGGGLSLVAREVDRPERHRTLRDTIGWSYDLLDPGARRALRMLAVAPDGADFATARELGRADVPVEGVEPADPLDTLAELVDASLLRVVDGVDAEPRFRLLHVVRQFALEALTAAEAEEARRRLARRMADVATDLGAQAQGANRLRAYDGLQAERENMRETLEWSLAPGGPAPPAERVALGLRVAVALGPYWQHHGQAVEGRRWLERAIALTDRAGHADRARRVEALEALQTLAGILYRQGETVAAQHALERTVAAWRAHGRDDLLAAGLATLGLCLRVHEEVAAARATLEEGLAVARRVGDPGLVAGGLTDLGILETDAGDPGRAARLFEQAIAMEEPTGDVWGPTVSRANLAVALLEDARPSEAFEVLAQVVPVLPQLDDVELTVVVLDALAGTLVRLGDDARAGRAHGAAERLRADAGLPMPEHDRQEVERAVAPGRDRLGASAWRAAVAEGSRLSAEEALRDATSSGGRPSDPAELS